MIFQKITLWKGRVSDLHVASASTSNAANPFPGTGVITTDPNHGRQTANGCVAPASANRRKPSLSSLRYLLLV